MKTWFTSDLHLGHANIARFCRRPSLRDGDLDINGEWISKDIKNKRCFQMNERLVAKWNQRVKEKDTVYHLGDFCYKSAASYKTWEEVLNGKIIHIKGNHDGNNGTRGLSSAVLETSEYCFFMVHRPPGRLEEVPDFCNVVLCGHVHEKWKHKWLDDKPVINVGVDVRKFAPMELGEVCGLINRLANEKEQAAKKEG